MVATAWPSPTSRWASGCSTWASPDAARAAAEVYAAHGRAIAEELYAVFKKLVWPAYKESGAPPDALREVVERLKPLSVASLVTAYEVAMDDAKREGIARRTGS